jgi:hypothetical protein
MKEKQKQNIAVTHHDIKYIYYSIKIDFYNQQSNYLEQVYFYFSISAGKRQQEN